MLYKIIGEGLKQQLDKRFLDAIKPNNICNNNSNLSNFRNFVRNKRK